MFFPIVRNRFEVPCKWCTKMLYPAHEDPDRAGIAVKIRDKWRPYHPGCWKIAKIDVEAKLDAAVS